MRRRSLGATPPSASAVTGILEAAERAAEQIRRDAKQQASEQDRAARADAERLTKELTEEARSLHVEAEELRARHAARRRGIRDPAPPPG
jgi:cell division septum initiation protein DivIVA